MASPEYDGPISRAEARRHGATDGQLHRQTRRGTLLRLHRGTYLASSAFDAMDAEHRHLARVHAAVAAQRTPTAVSHPSAALLIGLPLWNIDLTRVQLTQSRGGAGRRTDHLHVHAAPTETVPTVQIGGLTVTDPARTAFDIGCTVGYEEAVVVADAALKRRLTTRDDRPTPRSSTAPRNDERARPPRERRTGASGRAGRSYS